ncbi:DUF1499 domain-containing protein [Neorhizobium sp. JUb45]|uniref:DUF1499 domain-containing protein n=1 Tax=unclassified Neorhizobium TaxID=2629175 RepID=UPI001046A00D|nr:DUF1499 domain-containing protein [Neorhizobium sp. JUb45]TCR00019.1 uncharacterized protein DUF1499 [Neorhizobium sp. JUb45]
MTVRFVRPVSQSAFASRRIGLSALVLFLIAVAAHRFGPLTGPDFIAIVLFSAAIALVAVLFAVIGLARLWRVGAQGGLASAWGLVYAAPPIVLVGFAAILYFTTPPLYEVATDVEDPPVWIRQPSADQQWLQRPSMVTPSDRQVQLTAYPELTGRRYEGAVDRIYEAVAKVAKSTRISVDRKHGMELVEPDITERPAPKTRAESGAVPDNIPIPLPRPEQLRPGKSLVEDIGRPGDVILQGQTRTLILGLRFDVVIRLREEAETTMVDLRVAARYGGHDLGLSADIAQGFLRSLDSELLGLAVD